jgi:hypothetical protein
VVVKGPVGEVRGLDDSGRGVSTGLLWARTFVLCYAKMRCDARIVHALFSVALALVAFSSDASATTEAPQCARFDAADDDVRGLLDAMKTCVASVSSGVTRARLESHVDEEVRKVEAARDLRRQGKCSEALDRLMGARRNLLQLHNQCLKAPRSREPTPGTASPSPGPQTSPSPKPPPPCEQDRARLAEILAKLQQARAICSSLDPETSARRNSSILDVIARRDLPLVDRLFVRGECALARRILDHIDPVLHEISFACELQRRDPKHRFFSTDPRRFHELALIVIDRLVAGRECCGRLSDGDPAKALCRDRIDEIERYRLGPAENAARLRGDFFGGLKLLERVLGAVIFLSDRCPDLRLR